MIFFNFGGIVTMIVLQNREAICVKNVMQMKKE